MAQNVDDVALQFATNAAFGAFSAWAFTPISPWGGCLFGGIYGLVQPIAERGCHAIFGDSVIGKIITCALSIIAGIAASVTATTALGVTMSFEAGCTLAIAMLISALAFRCICGETLCCAFASNRAHRRY